MNGLDTGTVLKQLFSCYPNTEITAGTAAMYMRLLSDIPADELQTIVDQAVATCKFLPTIAELRDMRHSLNTLDRLTWTDGWNLVQREIRRIGSYGKPAFDDSITARVVASMGWRYLCMSEQPQIDRAQFRDMYNALLSRQDTEQKLLPQAREYADRAAGLIPISAVIGSLTDSRNGSK